MVEIKKLAKAFDTSYEVVMGSLSKISSLKFLDKPKDMNDYRSLEFKNKHRRGGRSKWK